RHTRSKRDWSSDVCSSDLPLFGNRLIDNQITQQTMADMNTNIHSAEAFTRYIILDDPQDTVEVAMAKILTANTAIETTETMIQRSEERRVGHEERCRVHES